MKSCDIYEAPPLVRNAPRGKIHSHIAGRISVRLATTFSEEFYGRATREAIENETLLEGIVHELSKVENEKSSP